MGNVVIALVKFSENSGISRNLPSLGNIHNNSCLTKPSQTSQVWTHTHQISRLFFKVAGRYKDYQELLNLWILDPIFVKSPDM